MTFLLLKLYQLMCKFNLKELASFLTTFISNFKNNTGCRLSNQEVLKICKQGSFELKKVMSTSENITDTQKNGYLRKITF